MLAKKRAIALDVRPAVEYRAGHIAGALCTPLSQLAQHVQQLPPRVQLVAYSRGPYCTLADHAVRELTSRGFRALRLVDGFPEWQRLGYPTDFG
jgi:rhodanese-related sulfurtransferase